MAMDEKEVLDQCEALKKAAREDTGEGWVDTYTKALQGLLQERLLDARRAQNTPSDVALAQYRAIHGHRRIIAGIHQEIELHSKGMEVVARATEDYDVILKGCRVRETAVRKIYGL
ncbi:hypothetical protein FA95DRAFT_1607964 [Auriscalpium vulgare]|uniref:Uncharacterized protein n=1 Tax=Auriscalpium vulgare TaxID=40419 RepID=A0ACB8RNL3_9AGAM|nr:hypothetical protein FA95DRAFT_1607964 [Auriscalpium vulgare]